MQSKTCCAVAVMLATMLAATIGKGADKADKNDDDYDAKVAANARKGLASATISLKEAVQLALRKVPNSREVEAELEVDGDEIDFIVEVIAGGKHQNVEIDAVTGEVEGVEDETDEDKDYLKLEEEAQKAKITLLRAIDIAAKKVTGGKVFEAAPDKNEKTKKLVYYIQLLARDKLIEVEVDAMSGTITDIDEDDGK